MALFVLYHVTDIDKALEEMRRVTKPDGKIVVTTSFEDNKFRIHELEAAIVAKLQGELAPPFTQTFTADNAPDMLSEYFIVAESIEHKSPIHLKDGGKSTQHSERLRTYLDGLESYRERHTYIPEGRCHPEKIPASVWEKTCQETALPLIKDEIQRNGSWFDLIHRNIFVCLNPK